mmetsp:Transcript_25620/g.59203  ORF Transcript_25620/g.59203 Transcript_25620/m.59203 type:complete len:114 (-) Transcript_25620:307-648(-)
MAHRSQRATKQVVRSIARVSLCIAAGLFAVLRPMNFIPAAQATLRAGSLQQQFAMDAGSGAVAVAALATAGAARQGSAKLGAAVALSVLAGGLASVRSPSTHARAACQSGPRR